MWDNQSDYSQCREQCLVDPFLTELEGNLTWDTWEDCYSPRHDRLVTDISEVIYYVGEWKGKRERGECEPQFGSKNWNKIFQISEAKLISEGETSMKRDGKSRPMMITISEIHVSTNG